MKFLNTILEMVFPAKCIACGQSGSDLCWRCLSNLKAAERESENWIFPFYDYRDPPIKKALWLFKYSGKKRLASVFAEAIYDKILEELSDLSTMQNFRNPVLIPIPLSRKRYRERGYNQAELICKELIRIHITASPSPWQGEGGQRLDEILTLETNVLVKPKDTEHQARIKDRRLRLKNLAGSFSIKNLESIKGRNIILIDDITTT